MYAITIILTGLLSFILGLLLVAFKTYKEKSYVANAFKLLSEHATQLKESILQHNANLQQTFSDRFHQNSLDAVAMHNTLHGKLQQHFAECRAILEQHKIASLQLIQDGLLQGLSETRTQVKTALSDSAQELSRRIEHLSDKIASNFQQINQQVEQRLASGFEQTNETFVNIIQRLAMIDAAQQQIAELSTNVVDLQAILTDKRSRGTFGEVQLVGLVRNVLPRQHFALQPQLSTNKRPDCLLFLPPPTGNIVIDAKFPLENFRLLMDDKLPAATRRSHEQQFRQDIRRHIQDISTKYIIPGETADGAIMFIPSESIFAEIHSHYPDLVESSQRSKVWMVSPTTLMAILTTARAVLKDADTAKQLHIIQHHLSLLAGDFKRFQERMDNVAKHIGQAHQDVQQVHTSARKISQRFHAIEQVDLSPAPPLVKQDYSASTSAPAEL